MDPVALFKDFLRRKGLRPTGPRLDVARSIFQTRDEHLSAEDLLDRLRLQGHDLSKATVYRTLALLTESGLLQSWDFGDGRRSYDPVVNRGQHDHLVCLQCRAVVEFSRPDLDESLQAVAREHGFQVLSRSLQIFGLCSRCK